MIRANRFTRIALRIAHATKLSYKLWNCPLSCPSNRLLKRFHPWKFTIWEEKWSLKSSLECPRGVPRQFLPRGKQMSLWALHRKHSATGVVRQVSRDSRGISVGSLSSALTNFNTKKTSFAAENLKAWSCYNFGLGDHRKNPHAHQNKIGTSPPPFLKKPRTSPP